MSPTRRQFLRLAASTGVATLLPWRRVAAYARSVALRKFVQPLAGLGPAGIPVAQPDLLTYPGIDYYRMMMGGYEQSLHPDLPPTHLWGYSDATAPNFRHLGGVIVARAGTPVRVSFRNNLPPVHPLAVDTTIDGAEGAENRAVAHLHGGFVPWPSDGGPFAWAAPGASPGDNGSHGISHVWWLPDAAGNLTDDVYYPNAQSARMLWYHDHALGITRLNAQVGLASVYILRDEFEDALVAAGAIPGLIPGTEIPLVIQDKTFIGAEGNQESSGRGQYGDLWYPSVYEPDRWDLDGIAPVPSAIPEFFGDTMLVNGLVYPYVDLEPRKYRLRLLNACNARFCNLRLVYAQGPDFPESTEPAVHRRGPSFLQIGNEAGFLSGAAGPVLLDQLLLAPAERADVIVDFAAVAPGSILILYNDAEAPAPDGDERYDYSAESSKGQNVVPGYGPNTRTLLQLRIGPRIGPKDPRPTEPLRLPSVTPLSPLGAVVRNLTLNEGDDLYGRLIQLLGTTDPTGPGAFGRSYVDAATETPAAGATEVWNILNLSGDVHPIHFHLVNVQILGRRAFKTKAFDGVPQFTGPFRPADPNEMGWKETVRMNPGEMTQVIVRFDLPPAPAGVAIPESPRTGGHEYVWHCHILEHEEHDMMRPLVVY